MACFSRESMNGLDQPLTQSSPLRIIEEQTPAPLANHAVDNDCVDISGIRLLDDGQERIVKRGKG